ncbi:hypothetical protein SESBI_26344 [Sesbania bispinosa]|nr:hypothetical protein SESBI_26344 [Sesbania bispinosa]
MLLVVVSSVIKSNQIISDLVKVWNVLEVRILVVVSLTLQTILIFFGNRRKYIANAWLQLIVWFTYLSADWIATVALGILSKDSKDPSTDPNFIVMAIWAPFLLVHLGGPDTITAYSLEDNELWLRHLLELFYQVAVALYVVYKSWKWKGSHLHFVTIPVLVAGIIKYGERTWSLRSGSSKNFRESILPPPDPGPNYAKFMDHYTEKKAEGYNVTLGKVIENPPMLLGHSQGAIANDKIPDVSSLHDGFCFFKIFKCLFADLILSFQDHRSSQIFFQTTDWKHAFQVVEVELGLIWAILWLSKHKNWGVDLLYKSISWFQKCCMLSHTRRWSNLMSQFNLIRFCLKDESVKCITILKLIFHFYPSLEKSYYQDTEIVPPELKELIFEQLKVKSEEAINIEACKQLCADRGDRVLEKWRCHDGDIKRSIKEVEFDQSILLWHIATDLCYYSDDLNHVSFQSCEISKLLSNYMLYLLVICPFMLPNGIGQIRFEDTCAEVDELLKERKYISESDQACKMILRVNTEIPPSEVKGDRSKSVLFDACRLAKSLQSLETEENWSKEQKWEMMSHVWVEMLCHAANQCRGLHHGKQLSKGGELLTHVWLLMAHLGITEQFQISRGHAREKLLLS